MSNVSQELTTEATIGAGNSPIMLKGVMTDNPSLQITIVKLVRTIFSPDQDQPYYRFRVEVDIGT